MKKIGFIDLDTTHPRSFIKRLNAMNDIKVTGVFDRGRKGGKKETEAFCEEFGVMEFSSVETLCENSDGIMVLSADWETHFEDVRVCMEKGIPCFCDKPVFSSREEINKFLKLAGETKSLFMGGSGWRWNSITQGFHEQNKDSQIKDILISGQNDLFYYGIHAVEWMLGLLGPGAEWIKHEIKGQDMSLASLGHSRDAVVRFILETKPDVGRLCWLNAGGKEEFITLNGDDIHNGICSTFVEMIKTGKQPAKYEDYVEALLIMFALEESRETGKKIKIADADKIEKICSVDFMKKYCNS